MICSCEQDYTCPTCQVDQKPVGKPVNVDAAIDEYAAVLQRIYDERTAGDYTFIGVLAGFNMAIRDLN